MKKLVITGATSFIGKHLIAALGCEWEITAVVRKGTNKDRIPQTTHIVELNMEEYDQLGSNVGPCDCLVHMAWNGTRGESRMDQIKQYKNVEYAFSGVQSVLNSGCGRIITAGSQAEYGPNDEKITEESMCRPNTEYGKAKLEFYHRVMAECEKRGVEYKEPRFFSLYGPGDYAGTMVMSMLKKMLREEPCDLTQCIQMWDFLYIDDAMRALAALCSKPCANGVYNFGSGDARKLRNYVEEMARITKTKSELRFGAVPYPETGMVSLCPDVSKLKQELNWKPEISFHHGICSVLNEMNHEEISG